jgi:signal transduction histidine kinase
MNTTEARTSDTAVGGKPSGWRALLAGRAPAPTTPARLDVPVVRRMNYVWLALVVALLVVGAGTAGTGQPALWQSWRGPAIVLACLAFVGWYVLLLDVRRRHGWPVPRPVAYGYLVAGFVLTALLLSFSASFLGLVFPLIGLSTGLLRPRETIVPVGVAVLMYLRAIGLLPPPAHTQLTDMIWILFSLAASVGMTYSITALIRERYHRELLFAELSEAHRQLRISAARDADLATLRERNRLAREMHDSLGHALVSIAIKLEAAQRLYNVDAARATAEMEEMKRLVRSTMTDLRHSLQGLRPAALEEQPLDAALAELAREMGHQTGVEATCIVDPQAARLDRGLQETLYRVGQEALTNVAKHARAGHVTLSLAIAGGVAVLEVSDDGVGLGATERTGTEPYGVRGMRERVEARGGVLTLGPRPEGGTVLRARLPAVEDR